jgi:hypothetical protein
MTDIPRETPDGKHVAGRCLWYSIQVQYECSRCGATLTYDHETSKYLGAHKDNEQNVECVSVDQGKVIDDVYAHAAMLRAGSTLGGVYSGLSTAEGAEAE